MDASSSHVGYPTCGSVICSNLNFASFGENGEAEVEGLELEMEVAVPREVGVRVAVAVAVTEEAEEVAAAVAVAANVTMEEAGGSQMKLMRCESLRLLIETRRQEHKR